MIDLEPYIDKMTDEYDNFVEAVEIWAEKPTTRNKKKVVEKHRMLCGTKKTIMHKVGSYVMYGDKV